MTDGKEGTGRIAEGRLGKVSEWHSEWGRAGERRQRDRRQSEVPPAARLPTMRAVPSNAYAGTIIERGGEE